VSVSAILPVGNQLNLSVGTSDMDVNVDVLLLATVTGAITAGLAIWASTGPLGIWGCIAVITAGTMIWVVCAHIGSRRRPKHLAVSRP
jgi:hypothetical protein